MQGDTRISIDRPIGRRYIRLLALGWFGPFIVGEGRNDVHRQIRRAAVVIAAVLTLAWVQAPAMASPSAAPPKPQVQTGKGYVKVKESSGVRVGSGTFYALPEGSKNDLIIVTDDAGNIPGGVTAEQLVAIAQSGSQAAAPVASSGKAIGTQAVALANFYNYSALPYTWTPAYSGTYVMGASGARWIYWFSVTSGSNQSAAGQGQGWYRGYNGGSFGVWSYWYGLGVATDGSNGGGNVPWDGVAAYAKFKAYSNVNHLAAGYWGN